MSRTQRAEDTSLSVSLWTQHSSPEGRTGSGQLLNYHTMSRLFEEDNPAAEPPEGRNDEVEHSEPGPNWLNWSDPTGRLLNKRVALARRAAEGKLGALLPGRDRPAGRCSGAVQRWKLEELAEVLNAGAASISLQLRLHLHREPGPTSRTHSQAVRTNTSSSSSRLQHNNKSCRLQPSGGEEEEGERELVKFPGSMLPVGPASSVQLVHGPDGADTGGTSSGPGEAPRESRVLISTHHHLLLLLHLLLHRITASHSPRKQLPPPGKLLPEVAWTTAEVQRGGESDPRTPLPEPRRRQRELRRPGRAALPPGTTPCFIPDDIGAPLAATRAGPGLPCPRHKDTFLALSPPPPPTPDSSHTFRPALKSDPNPARAAPRPAGSSPELGPTSTGPGGRRPAVPSRERKDEPIRSWEVGVTGVWTNER
ncbi:unnamed protein product [Pleuronectes platessa]|uniref:Uncharacterized protein n=1 Tax=Pleuronectes platessa TaxID=8262 RepID=A0A9N7Z8P7_PLEPL|nr:unnamed protein product [Pleuronectes platessa]